MIGALIKKLNSIPDDNNHVVSMIVDVTDIDVLNQFKLNLPDITHTMIVDHTVKVGMIFKEYIIYDETGATIIYPPELPIEKLNKIDELVNQMTFNLNESQMSIEELKIYKINKSKYNLKQFLDTTKYKYNDKYYSITEDKQMQLKSVLDTYKMVSDLNKTINEYNNTDEGKSNPRPLIEFILTWNETGKPCEEWDYNNLVILFLNIYNLVKDLVVKQQHIELSITAAETIEEIQKIDISF